MASTSTPSSSPETNFSPTFGAALIGIVFAAVFHGITILQGVFYYRTYEKDPISLKLLVALLLTLDALSLALCTHGVYTYLVIDFDNPLVLDSPIVWSIASEPLVNGAVALIVNIFLAHRIQVLNHRWWPLSVAIGVVALFAFAIATTAVVISNTSIGALSALTRLRWPVYAAVIPTVLIDLTIAAAMFYLLRRQRGGFAQTNWMIHRITLYVISTGMITATIAISGVIAYLLAPTDFYCLMFEFSSSKAYTNTFLATLNSRQSISASAHTTMGTVLQFGAAPPNTDANGAVGERGSSGSQNLIASLAHDVPDTEEGVDGLTAESSYPMMSSTDKGSDPAWV